METQNAKLQIPGKLQATNPNARRQAWDWKLPWNLELRGRRRLLDWAPLVLLTVLALRAQAALPAWVFMWVMAGAIFLGCKWLTWRLACRSGRMASIGRTIGYLLAWPGMDAPVFLDNDESGRAQPHSQTLRGFAGDSCRRQVLEYGCALPLFQAVGKILCGIGLIAFAARTTLERSSLLAGWVGMIGLVVFLHFGLFELLALAWQRAGVNVQPVMRAPLRSTSLADFWSTRWNTAFNKLAHDLAFRQLSRQFGVKAATLAVFLVSGLVHEAVISLPARGGFGLPTAYFFLQGLGVLAERSRWGRRACLGRSWRGWLFVMSFTAGPAFFLFHPPFVHHVILPMLCWIGAN